MKWKEMTGFRKAAFILVILCMIAGFTLCILDVVDVLAGIDILEDIIDCVFWLSMGIAFWEKESAFPILCFVLSGVKFIFLFI